MSATSTLGDRGTLTDMVRFHLSLNVEDLTRSVAFFRLLFDAPPAKLERDYAKFELDEPPVVLSLQPHRAPLGGKLNHLGFRLTNAESLVAMQKRLELGGVATQREEGVECCYARQTKFWVSDPDGNLWEMYTLEEDLDHRGTGHLPVVARSAETSAAAPAIWAHRLGEPLPGTIMTESDGVDEVFLQGTFNATLAAVERRQFLDEVFRVLKRGAHVTLHQLSAKTPLASLSQPLPGPAAAVQAIPSAEELVGDLESAGFVDVYFEKLGDSPCFMADGVECRETRLVGIKPSRGSAQETHQVLYKGPFREIQDDRGRTFRRGQWTTVDANTWQQLRCGSGRDQFVL